MKKWLVLALVFLLGLSGCTRKGVVSCPAAEESPVVESVVSAGAEQTEVWERAPELTVTDGAKAVPALKCTTSWHYERPDGTGTGINACGSGPLQSKQYMEPLVTDDRRAWLNFELAPDSVSVKCWSAECFGSYDHQVEEEHVQVQVLAADHADGSWSETISIPLKEGSWVYEVTAQWTRAEKYGGTVYYGFYTE